MCTTGDFHYAYSHGLRHVLRMRVPKGARLPHDKDEVRFPSKSEFIYKGNRDFGDVIIWDFEYILPEE